MGGEREVEVEGWKKVSVAKMEVAQELHCISALDGLESWWCVVAGFVSEEVEYGLR